MAIFLDEKYLNCGAPTTLCKQKASQARKASSPLHSALRHATLRQVHVWAPNVTSRMCRPAPGRTSPAEGDKIHLSIWPGFMGTRGTAKHKVILLLLGAHGRNARTGARSG